MTQFLAVFGIMAMFWLGLAGLSQAAVHFETERSNARIAEYSQIKHDPYAARMPGFVQ